jgi:phage gp36-like protein
MAYCTRVDLVDRFGEADITDLESSRPNAVAEAIDDASALIDGYVAGRYPLPLAEVPVILKRIARDLVRYSLDVDPNETVIKRRDEAVSYLKDLAQGKATLGVPQAAEPDSLDTAEMQSDGHVFSRKNTNGFI